MTDLHATTTKPPSSGPIQDALAHTSAQAAQARTKHTLIHSQSPQPATHLLTHQLALLLATRAHIASEANSDSLCTLPPTAQLFAQLTAGSLHTQSADMARVSAKTTTAAAATTKATPTTRQSALEKEKERLREQALSKPKGEKKWGKFSTSTSSAQTKSTMSTRSKSAAAIKAEVVEPVQPVAAVAVDKVKKRATPKAAQPKPFESYLPTPGDSPVSDNNETTALVKRAVAPKSAPRLRRDSIESYLGAPLFALEGVEAEPGTGFSVRVWTSSTMMSPPSLKRKEMYGEGDWTSDEEDSDEESDDEEDLVRPNSKRQRIESVEPMPEKIQVIDEENDYAANAIECEESDEEDIESDKSVEVDEADEDIPTISSTAVLAELTGQTEEAVRAERAVHARKEAMEQAKTKKRSFDEGEDDNLFLPKHKRARTSAWAFPSSSSKSSASSSKSSPAANGGSSRKASHTAKRSYDLSDDDDDEDDDDEDELVPGNKGIQRMFAEAVCAAKRKFEKDEAHLKPHEHTVFTSTHECLLPKSSKDRKAPVKVERASITGAPVKQSKKRSPSGSKKTKTLKDMAKPKDTITSKGNTTPSKMTANKRKTASKRTA